MSSTEATIVLLVVVGLGWAIPHGTIGDEGGRRAGAIVFGGLLAALALTLVVPFHTRDVALSPAEQDWIAVAKAGRSLSKPRDVFLVPPAGPELFPLWSFRPVVATFSAFEFGSGDSEWVRRISIITGGDPRVFEPISGYAAASGQAQLVESDYDHAVATSRRPLCAFNVRFVVLESSVTPPVWLAPVDSTPTYDLYKVRPRTCPRS